MSTSTGLPALDNTMGVLLVGVMMAMGLWGASSVQVYYYYNRYTKDEWWIKSLVALVWALDTTHQGLITHTAYTYLVTQYGNSAFLGEIVPTLLIEVAVSAIIIVFVQSFFILRVWKLSHGNYFICAISGSIVFANFLTQCVYTGKALNLNPLTYVELATLFQLSRTINIISAASDVVIAFSLIWLLQSSRTGFKRSDSIINRLILFSLNTGLLTSLDAIASLITITVFPDNFIYIMFYVTCSRLYTNSLMATLNSRKATGGFGDDSTGEASMSMSQGRFRSRAVEVDAPAATLKGLANNPHTLSIKVNTETETVHDMNAGDIKRATSDSDTDVASWEKHYSPTTRSA